MALKLLLVGARCTRQGTGPFIAAALARAGVQVGAIVGTAADSVAEARAQLQDQYGIHCAGYTDLREALTGEQPDAVALCSPWPFHAEQLAQVVAAGCHCLVEKPLAWPASSASVDALVSAFEESELLLQMVSQWPCTLAAFSALHGPLAAAIDRFAMGLSPISIGPDMVTDAAPHFISMLQALLGEGSCEDIAVDLSEDRERLLLRCRYRHGTGAASASLVLETCRKRPRPAWYQIDDMRVDRDIELPHYQQYFRSGESRVALPDPMQQVVDAFVAALAAVAGGHPATAGESLRGAHDNLLRLASALPADFGE